MSAGRLLRQRFLLVAASLCAAAHQRDLKDYDTSKGTIRFQPAMPLSEKLVRKLVKARIAENEARQQARNRQ